MRLGSEKAAERMGKPWENHEKSHGHGATEVTDVPMLPPPRVIRVVEEAPCALREASWIDAGGPEEPKVLQVFLDASVEPVAS